MIERTEIGEWRLSYDTETGDLEVMSTKFGRGLSVYPSVSNVVTLKHNPIR